MYDNNHGRRGIERMSREKLYSRILGGGLLIVATVAYNVWLLWKCGVGTLESVGCMTNHGAFVVMDQWLGVLVQLPSFLPGLFLVTSVGGMIVASYLYLRFWESAIRFGIGVHERVR